MLGRREKAGFQVWPDDVLSSSRIALMSDLEFRAYFVLWCHCWNLGCVLPEDRESLRRLVGLRADGVTDLVLSCFDPHPTMPGTLTHKKLYRQLQFTKIRKSAGQKGGQRSAEARGEPHTQASPPATAEANHTANDQANEQAKGQANWQHLHPFHPSIPPSQESSTPPAPPNQRGCGSSKADEEKPGRPEVLERLRVVGRFIRVWGFTADGEAEEIVDRLETTAQDLDAWSEVLARPPARVHWTNPKGYLRALISRYRHPRDAHLIPSAPCGAAGIEELRGVAQALRGLQDQVLVDAQGVEWEPEERGIRVRGILQVYGSPGAPVERLREILASARRKPRPAAVDMPEELRKHLGGRGPGPAAEASAEAST